MFHLTAELYPDHDLLRKRWHLKILMSVRVFFPVDVKAVDDAFLISALLPGIEADDIDVQILDKTVSIRGNIEKQLDNEESKILVSELPFGHFSRVLTLPTKLDPAEAVGNLKDGVFTLRVPKAEEVRPRVINISAE